MGLLAWLKNTPEDTLTYSPGGSMLNVRITYNTKSDLFYYHGRYGVSAKFKGDEIKKIENKEVSRTHRVLLIQGDTTCLATFDVLPNLVCDNLVAWIESYGHVAYDFNEQKKGNWHNMAEPLGTAPHLQNKEDSMEAIKKLKELLDLGAITEEEFTTKKAELLKKI